MKTTTGWVFERDGHWYCAFNWTDENGIRRRVVRSGGENKSQAQDKLQDVIAEHKTTNRATLINRATLTFKELCDWYKEKYAVAPVYINDRKVQGLRTWKNVRLYVDTLEGFFGERELRQITYGQIEDYKRQRLQAKTQYDKQRCITSVHRELEVLRRMLRLAVREGWLQNNPFTNGDPLVLKSDERKREMILSRDAEKVLLSTSPIYLKEIIITAVDTGLRKGELFSLLWNDIDLESMEITVREINSKTAKTRVVPMTHRVYQIINVRWLLYKYGHDGYQYTTVFGIKSHVKKAFRSAAKRAGIPALRFHDLRHTFCTRMIEAGVPAETVARISGHDQMSTFYRYVNTDAESRREAALALERFNGGQ